MFRPPPKPEMGLRKDQTATGGTEVAATAIATEGETGTGTRRGGAAAPGRGPGLSTASVASGIGRSGIGETETSAAGICTAVRRREKILMKGEDEKTFCGYISNG